MNALRPTIDRTLAALRRPGHAAVAVIVLALAAALLWVAPLVRQRHDLEAAQSQRLLHRATPATRRARDDATPDLPTFYAAFPPRDSTLRWLAELDAAAIGSGIVLKSGDYRMEAIAATPLRRYRIVLPVSGSYAQLRAFIDAVLAAVPAAALEDVQFTRAAGASAALDGKLTFALYLREAR